MRFRERFWRTQPKQSTTEIPMTEMNFANLMDLASVDTSDLSAQTSRLQRQGIYILELTELKFVEQAPSDPAEPMNYNLTTKGNTLAFMPLDPNESAEGMEGRDVRERIFLYGKDIKEGIQLLMGRFKVVGFKHKGVMGGVEGGPAGWVDDAVGKRIAIRVRHYVRKSDGQEAAAIDWLSPKAMEKAGLQWEMLARDFVDEKGEVVDLAA
jgi:hypothetical protein